MLGAVSHNDTVVHTNYLSIFFTVKVGRGSTAGTSTYNFLHRTIIIIIIIDVTVVSTLADSYLHLSAQTAGGAADLAVQEGSQLLRSS